MNCPYCNNEMELGKVEMVSSSPGYIKQTFIPEYELQKGFVENIKETFREIISGIMVDHSISLKNNEKAYYCECCGKVFAEYDLQ